MRFSFLVLILTLSASPFAEASLSGVYGQPWKFIQAAGGIAVGMPLRSAQDSVVLPIFCDVSGRRKVTRAPSQMNSSLAVSGIQKNVSKGEISISVVTGLASSKSSSSCPPIGLGNVPADSYQVFYNGSDNVSHSLGKVTVP